MTTTTALLRLSEMALSKHILKVRRAGRLWASRLPYPDSAIVQWYAYGLMDGAIFTAQRGGKITEGNPNEMP